MVPRVWTCVEPPVLLRLLAMPLHPLAILLLFAAAFASLALGREALSKALRRVAVVALLALFAALLAFGMMALALVKTHSNPTSVLRFAPWFWSTLGPIALTVGVYFCRVPREGFRKALLVRATNLGLARRAANLCAFLLAALVALLIAGRSVITDEHQGLSAPYRTFEFLLPDQIESIASDECLAARVLEYGPKDPYVGEKAAWKLKARGKSAADGVASRLNQTRADWPPEPNAVTESGILWSLDFLHKQDADAKAVSWNDIHWKNELERLNRSHWTLRDAHWL